MRNLPFDVFDGEGEVERDEPLKNIASQSLQSHHGSSVLSFFLSFFLLLLLLLSFYFCCTLSVINRKKKDLTIYECVPLFSENLQN